MLSYSLLKIIWWFGLLILGIGFCGFVGFDLGVGILLLFMVNTNIDRRVLINSIGATWDGNQVWLITLGGATFAAWPMLYGSSFSGMYVAFLLILFSLMLRPPSFEYRSKMSSANTRSLCDLGIFLGSFVPSLLVGVFIANIYLGIPYYIDQDMMFHGNATLLSLVSPFSVLFGVFAIFVFMSHGAAFLTLKLKDDLLKKATKLGVAFNIITFVIFLALIASLFFIDGYKVITNIDINASLVPIDKEVVKVYGYWAYKFIDNKYALIVPVITGLSMLSSAYYSFNNKYRKYFISSWITIIGICSCVGVSLFPFIFVSSSNPSSSLLVWDSSSSQLTLMIMFVASSFFIPLIIFYTSWVYSVMFGRISSENINNKKSYFY